MDQQIQQRVQAVLRKPVTRKQFLQHIGVAVLGVFGVTALLGNLAGQEQHKQAGTNKSFGTRKFGA
jgi:hypothetical protein